jgi:hypothetical protein
MRRFVLAVLCAAPVLAAPLALARNAAPGVYGPYRVVYTDHVGSSTYFWQVMWSRSRHALSVRQRERGKSLVRQLYFEFDYDRSTFTAVVAYRNKVCDDGNNHVVAPHGYAGSILIRFHVVSATANGRAGVLRGTRLDQWYPAASGTAAGCRAGQATATLTAYAIQR